MFMMVWWLGVSLFCNLRLLVGCGLFCIVGGLDGFALIGLIT